MKRKLSIVNRQLSIVNRQLNCQLSIVNCQLVCPLSIVLMLGATSCEKEILDNGQAAGIALADGQFIVDYSGEPRTRAISENLSKGARINSLTYLLYQDAGTGGMANATLVKRREIPGLKGHGENDTENWPLTRENMTWEQREALKDTLNVGNTYYAVFVANADASLWGDTSPLKNADLPATEGATAPTYSAAYLQLSSDVPFDDYNMFYLATETIDGTTASREQPQDCPITLRRIVTRTDWWFERLPEWDILQDEVAENDTYIYKVAPGDGELKLPEGVGNYLERLTSNLIFEIWNKSSESIMKQTEDFLEALITYFTEQGTSTEDPDSPTLLEPWAGYVAAVEEVQAQLATTEGESLYLTKLLDEKEGQLIDILQNNITVGCANNSSIRSEWKNSWRNGLFAQIQYKDANPRGDRYYLAGTVAHEGTENTSPRIAVDVTNTTLMSGLEFDGFHFVGLANPELNGAEQINWYTAETGDGRPSEPSLSVPAEMHVDGQGNNERYQILYRPMTSFTIVLENDEWKATLDVPVVCDLASSLPFASGVSEDLSGAINAALNELSVYSGSTLQAFRFGMPIPDLSKEATIIINCSWNEPERVY